MALKDLAETTASLSLLPPSIIARQLLATPAQAPWANEFSTYRAKPAATTELGDVAMMDIHSGFQSADRSPGPEALFRFLDEANALDSIQSYRQRMLEIHPPQPLQRVLDIGCGIGHSTLDLARAIGATGSVIGVDKSDALIAEARRRAEGSALPLEYGVQDACRLRFPDDHFDVCRVERVLMYVEEPERALDEMMRVLRPGGHFALFEFDYECIVVDAPDEALTRRIVRLVTHSIPSPWIGRQLPRLLRERGGRNLSVVPHTVMTPLNMFRQVVGGTIRSAVERGALEAAAADRWWGDLEWAAARDDFLAGFLGFLVCGDLAPGGRGD